MAIFSPHKILSMRTFSLHIHHIPLSHIKIKRRKSQKQRKKGSSSSTSTSISNKKLPLNVDDRREEKREILYSLSFYCDYFSLPPHTASSSHAHKSTPQINPSFHPSFSTGDKIYFPTSTHQNRLSFTL